MSASLHVIDLFPSGRSGQLSQLMCHEIWCDRIFCAGYDEKRGLYFSDALLIVPVHTTYKSQKPTDTWHITFVDGLNRSEWTFEHDLFMEIRSAEVGDNSTAAAERLGPEKCLDLTGTAFACHKLLEVMRDRFYVFPDTCFVGHIAIT